MVSVSRSTYCRTGPGEDYEQVGVLMEGEEAEVVGISADGGTWIIKNPDGEGECWLWGYYATVTGPVEILPEFTPPPTPEPAFDWSGEWMVAVTNLAGEIDLVVLEPMNVTVDGTSFTGFWLDESYSGTISEDDLSVSGTWYGPGRSGAFTMYAVGEAKFQGNIHIEGEVYGMCGDRGGTDFPSPCRRD